MAWLSDILRFHLVDDRQQRIKLFDLAISLTEETYPLITHFLFQDKNKIIKFVAWEQVRKIDWKAKRILVENLTNAATENPIQIVDELLLRRDVLDALIIDLQNRRTTRANDLWLGESGDRLELCGVNTGLQAILHRLSLGFIESDLKENIQDWKYIEFLRGTPQLAREGKGYHRRITRLPPGEIASLSEGLPYLHATELLVLLPDPLAADVLEAMSNERELQVFEELEENHARRLLELMAPNSAADLIRGLKTDVARHYLEIISGNQSRRIIELLRYPENTAGSLMNNNFVFAPSTMTVEEAHKILCPRISESDFTYYVYVVDDEATQLLQGVISLRDLYIAAPEKTLGELMNPYLTTLNPLEPARQAADKVLSSHQAALPVTGQKGQMLGLLTVDAAIAQAAPQSWIGRAPKIFS